MLKTALQTRPQGRKNLKTYPLGHVEDYFSPRTQLRAFFSILLDVEAEVDDIAFLDHVFLAL